MNRRMTVALSAALAPMLMAVLPVWSAPPSPPPSSPSKCTPQPSPLPGPFPPDATNCQLPTPQIDDYANLAWQVFKMVVWPADRKPDGVPRRGEPDLRRPLADLAGPRVFETYKADWETFLRFAAPPLAWDKFPDTASACGNQPAIKPGTLVLSTLAEFGNVREQAGSGPSGKPITNVLVGQNRKLARYLVGFDKNEYGVILGSGLFDAANLPSLLPGTPPTDATRAPDGALIVKSAWIELEGLNIDRTTIYHRRALVEDIETHNCHKAEVGLVGLHIRYKTPSRPQWIWMSFEHLRNVPPAAEAANENKRGASYIFNDRTGATMPDDPPPDTLVGSSTFSAHPDPFNVQRLSPLARQVADANAKWQTALAGSVWAHYQLVVVEWPVIGSSPEIDMFQATPNPPQVDAAGSNLLNTTMETFLQKKAGPDDGLRFTCMGCHNGARALDYVFTIPINANDKFHMEPSPWRKQMIDYLTQLVARPTTR